MKSEHDDVAAVDFVKGEAITDSGEIIKIAGYMGPDGEKSDPEDAVACIGVDESGQWWAIDMAAFDEVTVH